ncbi:MAG: ATPase, T2SS/T4P/T4SS family [candidate division Zixibacteria bacterium]|nr:ATPase, T2SS/T4P/T4SS family [candidate division Zixibacteria bacterium]
MTEQTKRKPIGVILRERGVINSDHVNFALMEQKISSERFGEILERLGFITQYDVATTIAWQEDLPYLDVEDVVPGEKELQLFNKNICLKNIFLPIKIEGNQIDIAIADHFTINAVTQLITRQTGLRPRISCAEKNKIINKINASYYFLENPVESLLEKEINLLKMDTEHARGYDKIISLLLQYAVKMRATDIHIRPMSSSVSIAFRIDGVMVTVLALPASLLRLVSAMKLKSEIDIAEQRLPQDGRFSETILNNGYDFRVSTVVTQYGENMVVRILPLSSSVMGMTQLGFFPEDVKMVEDIFTEPFGIVLLTGPTGSGKSTTLFAGIRSLDLMKKHVITVENPIEYKIPLLRQTQVNEKAGYTFSSAIRYFLRHDPDVILVGEIRDRETAATAVSASTTGHMVLSTLHTNSAIGAIARLKDLGVNSFLVADSLLGVVSQRLVRKICPHCKESYAATEEDKRYLQDADITTLYRGTTCDFCAGTGYHGRTLVYEVLKIDKVLASMIDNDEPLDVITTYAMEHGFNSIFNVCRKKVVEGVTTVAEAKRVIGKMRN